VKDGDFVGVAAADINTARKALLAIDAKWDEKKDHPSHTNIFDYLVKNTTTEGGANEGGGKIQALQKEMWNEG
jgi:hypothetical protein